MALPQKKYYSLEEISERWGIRLRDVCDYALDGVFEVYTWLGKVQVEIYQWEEVGPKDAFRIPLERRWFNDYVIVQVNDLREVFRAERADIGTYRLSNDLYVDIIERDHPYIIELRDLVVSKCERDKVEQEYGLVFDDIPQMPIRKAHPLSFAGRPTVMHVIIEQMELRARQGRLCASPTAESDALREWALAHIKDMQVPQRKSIYNRIHKRYQELAMPQRESA